MKVWIKKPRRASSVGNAWLRGLVRSVLESLGRGNAEIGLVLTSDRRMRVLNRTYRGKDKTTDVLSFSLSLHAESPPHRFHPARAVRATPGPPALVGDVVISLDTAERQAHELGSSLRDELARLLIHGLLHLLGHDHERPEEARRMRRLELRLWRRCAQEGRCSSD